MMYFVEILTLVAMSLFVYHHFVYPRLLHYLAKGRREKAAMSQPSEPTEFAAITVILPCFNEQRYIADKLFNFAYLDYPRDKLKVIVANDGSTDDTVAVYLRTIQHPLLEGVNFELIDFKQNRGKVAVLNQVMSTIKTGLVCLSDVSALISVDAFKIIHRHMQDPAIGVVAASYNLLNPGSAGEEVYWSYQVKIKQDESKLGSAMGVHGALYCLRAELFQQLPLDTINDDFMIPMQIVNQGYRAVYDCNIVGIELEQSNLESDFQRRVRIAAGNAQQAIRLLPIFRSRQTATIFNFFSGKFLRVLMPWCMLISCIGSALLATTNLFWLVLFTLQCFGYLVVAAVHLLPSKHYSKPIKLVHYLVLGHAVGLLGQFQLLRRSPRVLAWRKVEIHHKNAKNQSYLPLSICIAKRTFDVLCATAILFLTLPLWFFIALAIKIESKGPVFFRQLRIGKSTASFTTLFYMIKFRTMVQDAEKHTGAVWATKADPRVTKVGWFLRKTRLDELPQVLNVLKGEMSMVGPRPERPELCGELERQIPFFSERTCYVQPGITGLSQVSQGYDTCIDDVKKKMLYDHSYALSLHSMVSWLKMDVSVLLKTLLIMLTGRGQ